jgi:hypothetical protein
MRVDSLGGLGTAFAKWRLKKQHVREQVPERLIERARRAAAVHGVYAVAQAAKVDYCRLAGVTASAAKKRRGRVSVVGRELTRAPARLAKRATLAAAEDKKGAAAAPSYSRLELPTRESTARPLAEVETPMGVKLRLFAITPETVALLSTLSGPGRAL